MQPNLERTMISLAECAQETRRRGQSEGEICHAITLSAGTGAGGGEVGRILAERLQVSLYDKEIMEAIANATHLNKNLLKRLDERVDGLKGAWLYSILAGENFSKDNYLRTLVHVLLDIASCCCHHGGVIMGHGGSFILADRPVFRVHIVGSSTACAARVAARESITRGEAEKRVRRKDKARRDYVKKLFKCKIDDPIHFDLVVNSDHFTPAQVGDLILQAKKYTEFE